MNRFSHFLRKFSPIDILTGVSYIGVYILIGWKLFIPLVLILGILYYFLLGRNISGKEKLRQIFLGRVGGIFLIFFLFFTVAGITAFICHTVWLGPTVHSYTLSNGTKTIEFQGMHHIGTQDFYANIRQNIVTHRKEGFTTVFLERLGTGSIENEKLFSKATGYDDNFDSLDDAMRDAQGLVKQSYKYLLDNYEDYSFYYVDLNVDDAISQAEKKYGNLDAEAPVIKSDFSRNFQDFFHKNISDIGKKYFSSMIIFAFILSPSVDPLEEKIDDIATDLELNFRDKHLSDALISSKENKIIVLYGEGHVPGVYRNLRSVDPNWKIVDKKTYRAFQK